MNIVAVMGSYRKEKSIDSLTDFAIEGALESCPNAKLDKIVLVDHKIEYCRNCMACRNDDPSKRIADCIIKDDMQGIYPLLDEADCYIFATPVNMGHETAIIKAFMERICFVLAKPGNFPLKGCPTPRNPKKKSAVAIVSSGVVPPILRYFCDEATPLIKDFCRYVLNARLVGSIYAGALENRGTDFYSQKAKKLGQKLLKHSIKSQ